jgi:hypothetical protein
MKGGDILMSAARGAAGSAISQGIGVAVGLQKKFDFAGVAAAGLAGGVSAAVGKALGAGPLTDLSARNVAANLATSTAGAIANAAARSLVNGSDFGDNLMAALPDVIGSTIGNMIGSAFARDGRSGGGGGSTAYDGDGTTEPFELSGPVVDMGDGTVQITLPDGTTSRGAPAEMLAVVQGRLRAAGVPESAAVAAAEAIIAGEFESGDAVLRYREGGGGNLAHDVIRNIVYGRDGAIVLGQWANKFGANPTAFHMIGDLSNNDPGYVLLLAQWAALSAMTVPDYAAPLLTISAQLGAAYQPDIVVPGGAARANRSPRVQYALDRIAAYEREHPGSQARWERERAAQNARVQGALAQFDRDAIYGATLGPRLGAEMAAGSALLKGAGALFGRLVGRRPVVPPAATLADEAFSTVANPRNLLSRQGPGEMSGNVVRRLARGMRANGFNPAHPIEVANVEGRLVILDGHHRAAAAIRAGITEVPVVVRPVSAARAAELRLQVIDAAARRATMGR